MAKEEKETVTISEDEIGEMGDADFDGDGEEQEVLPPDGRAEDPETGERVSSADARKRQADAVPKRKSKSASR